MLDAEVPYPNRHCTGYLSVRLTCCICYDVRTNQGNCYSYVGL